MASDLIQSKTKYITATLTLVLLISLILVIDLGDGGAPNRASPTNEHDDRSTAYEPIDRRTQGARTATLLVDRQRPDKFTDTIRFDFSENTPQGYLRDTMVWVKIERSEQVPFIMTYVPGDPSAGVKPFYLSATEVSATMFYPWATGNGLAGQDWVEWAKQGLRPSRISEFVRQYGPLDRPALGMSRRCAELYCAWLSEQTGRAYRLPTDKEWQTALKLAGGVPVEHCFGRVFLKTTPRSRRTRHSSCCPRPWALNRRTHSDSTTCWATRRNG